MKIAAKLFLWNAILGLFFLGYLCSVDALFVFVMHEVPSFLNNLPLLVSAMPFVGVFISNSIIEDSLGIGRKVIVLIAIFGVMSLAAVLQLYWVATHFHSLLGGTI